MHLRTPGNKRWWENSQELQVKVVNVIHHLVQREALNHELLTFCAEAVAQSWIACQLQDACQ
jgi:hypothetical protein